MLLRLTKRRFVLDGELIISTDDTVSFDALQMRLHPAASRIAKLSESTPANFIAFDYLASGDEILAAEPLASRRRALEALLTNESEPRLLLSPITHDRRVALNWLNRGGGALDGVIAKRLADPYTPGKRTMVKVKQRRTADCVVGGFRYGAKHHQVGSLLLGLYDDASLLNHVGYTSSISTKERSQWTATLEALIGPPGFTGNAPGGPSRWASDRTNEWQPLRSELVVEVLYDQVTAGRFRHGTKLLRRRYDKVPSQCTMEQLAPPLTPAQLRQLIVG
jgi:ATP-dependent DNA ligase